MTTELSGNWKLLLANSLMREKWFISPQYVDANALMIISLLEGKSNFLLSGENRPAYEMSAGNGTAIWGIRDDWSKLPQNSVAVFPVRGSMMKHGTWCSYGTEEIERFMAFAAQQKNVAGAVLQIDSPGGEVASVAPMHRGIEAFKAKGKSVVSVCDDCFSAAYYTAIKTDFILAENDISSGFGSIGVAWDFWDVSPVLKKAGYVHYNIKAAESFDKNVAFEKALEGDYEQIITEFLSPLAQKFQNDVKEARGARLKTETPGILSGKTFFAKDAFTYGMIDGFGDLNRAVQLVLELS